VRRAKVKKIISSRRPKPVYRLGRVRAKEALAGPSKTTSDNKRNVEKAKKKREVSQLVPSTVKVTTKEQEPTRDRCYHGEKQRLKERSAKKKRKRTSETKQNPYGGR